jgi:hypothetical protein
MKPGDQANGGLDQRFSIFHRPYHGVFGFEKVRKAIEHQGMIVG